MQANTAKNALLFLHRVQLSGQEVPAFVEVVRAIEEYVSPKGEQTNAQEADAIGMRAGNW